MIFQVTPKEVKLASPKPENLTYEEKIIINKKRLEFMRKERDKEEFQSKCLKSEGQNLIVD